MTGMAIVNCKKRTFWPVLDLSFVARPAHVQDNANAIFIVLAMRALMRISSVANYVAVVFRGKPGRLKVSQGIVWLR